MAFTRVTTSDPAAGVEHSYTMLEDTLLRYFAVELVTGSDVATRTVHLVIKDASGNLIFRCAAGGSQSASLTRRYIGRPGDYASPAVNDTVFVIPLPLEGIPVVTGDVITTETTNFDNSLNEDNFGKLTLVFGSA